MEGKEEEADRVEGGVAAAEAELSVGSAEGGASIGAEAGPTVMASQPPLRRTMMTPPTPTPWTFRCGWKDGHAASSVDRTRPFGFTRWPMVFNSS